MPIPPGPVIVHSRTDGSQRIVSVGETTVPAETETLPPKLCEYCGSGLYWNDGRTYCPPCEDRVCDECGAAKDWDGDLYLCPVCDAEDDD